MSIVNRNGYDSLFTQAFLKTVSVWPISVNFVWIMKKYLYLQMLLLLFLSQVDQRDPDRHRAFDQPRWTRTVCWETVHLHSGFDQCSRKRSGHRFLWSVLLICVFVQQRDWDWRRRCHCLYVHLPWKAKPALTTVSCPPCLFSIRQCIASCGGGSARDQSDDGLDSRKDLHSLCSSRWRRPCCYLPLWQTGPAWYAMQISAPYRCFFFRVCK